MTTLQPQDRIANNSQIGNQEEEAKRILKDHFDKIHTVFTEKAAELGTEAVIADLYRVNALDAETALRDGANGMIRSLLKAAFETLDDHGQSLKVDGRTYHRTEATPGQAMTIFGPVDFCRSRYRPSGRGEAVLPVEATIGLTVGKLTPAAAGLSMYFMSSLTARESEEVWNKLCGQGPSTASLVRLSAAAGRCMEACGDELMEDLRASEGVPEDAASLVVSLDGVMMRMNAEASGDEVTEAGWREASCGVVALVDGEGKTLQSRCFGRLPEAGKVGLKSQLMAETFHWLKRKPDLKLVAVADGARDNWAFLERLNPDRLVLDFWHAAEHLGVVADAAFGSDTARRTAWFEKWRHVLRHDPRGVSKVIDALCYLLTKGTGADVIRRELAYFRNNRSRMDYASAADAGQPIGSGAVESANKVLVTTRMKRSGQRWSREGGQGVLTFRSLVKSGRFDRAWAKLTPRMNRSDWQPPNSTASNHKAVQVALAA